MAAAQNMAMTTTQKIIAIAVTIIIISTVALPIIDDMADGAKENRSNVGQLYRASDSGTIEMTYSSGTVTINGYSFQPSDNNILMWCDEFYLNYNIYGPVAVILGDSTIVPLKAASISDGVASLVTNGDETITVNYSSKVLYVSEKGNYGAFKTPFYVNDDSVLYFAAEVVATNAGLSPSTTDLIRAIGSGEYDDIDCTISASESLTGTLSTSLNSEDLGDCILIDPQATIMKYTDSVGTYTGSADLLIFAPIVYKVDSSMTSLIGVLPIILILVPLMMAVRMMTLRRN